MINEALEALVKRYAAGLPLKVGKAAESVAQFIAQPGDGVRCGLAYRAVHSLVGSCGTYGFYDMSGIARAAEMLLKPSAEYGMPLLDEEKTQLQDLMFRLGTRAADAAQRVSAGAA